MGHKKVGCTNFQSENRKSTLKWLVFSLLLTIIIQKDNHVSTKLISGTSRLAILKNFWSDLIDNPQNWQDYRINKVNACGIFNFVLIEAISSIFLTP